MDIQMPYKSGIEATQEILSLPAFESVIIININTYESNPKGDVNHQIRNFSTYSWLLAPHAINSGTSEL
ncbi:hypothetical protein [Paenibacillus monticola]|uniref:hypothetical protein n=1 Tax=Paenibacillus monticola TaxID=2666075 RepID=UPI00189EB196|nr:hypothetical protein [Paenibacillus monticola]